MNITFGLLEPLPVELRKKHRNKRERHVDTGRQGSSRLGSDSSQNFNAETPRRKMEPTAILIVAAFLVVAVLYSSVGHGGASGYLAVMAFLAVAPEVTRPTALVLNLFVASIATVQFYRAGYFSWRIFLPFAIASIPMAFVGGMIHLPTDVYKIVLGAVLMFAAFRLAINLKGDDEVRDPPIVGLC